MTPRTAAPDTRTRLLETALELFTTHGVEGTSLQMIADALGITKAAVYYHFKTKDEIAAAVVEPALSELDLVVEQASRQRRRGAQVDHLLEGFVDAVIRHRTLVSWISRDPGILRVVALSWTGRENVNERMLEMLAGPEDDPHRMIAAHAAVTGIALTGGAPRFADLDDESLRASLLDVGRRLLGRPRRAGH